jgi:hypothetical protein
MSGSPGYSLQKSAAPWPGKGDRLRDVIRGTARKCHCEIENFEVGFDRE